MNDIESTVDFFPADRPWIEHGDVLSLKGSECCRCNAKGFPFHAVCHMCGSDEVRGAMMATRGRLYSFAVVHVAPKGFCVPYAVAYVDLEDGVRVFGQVEGEPEPLSLDIPVDVVLGLVRTTSDGRSVLGYKFRRSA